MLIRRGVQPKVISERLGHASTFASKSPHVGRVHK